MKQSDRGMVKYAPYQSLVEQASYLAKMLSVSPCRHKALASTIFRYTECIFWGWDVVAMFMITQADFSLDISLLLIAMFFTLSNIILRHRFHCICRLVPT